MAWCEGQRVESAREAVVHLACDVSSRAEVRRFVARTLSKWKADEARSESRGRGLGLVVGLSDRWGFETVPAGKIVRVAFDDALAAHSPR